MQNYPFKAPTVRFETTLFHPNVDVHGNICLDILKEKWSAAYSVRTILLSIQVIAHSIISRKDVMLGHRSYEEVVRNQ